VKRQKAEEAKKADIKKNTASSKEEVSKPQETTIQGTGLSKTFVNILRP
jgi:hypothetical protein